MTTIREDTQKCVVCGFCIKVLSLMSTNSFGPSDLDGRPSGMARSTLSHWLQECPRCRFVNHDLRIKIPNAKAVLESSEYREIAGDPEGKQLASLLENIAELKAAGVKDENADSTFFRPAWLREKTLGQLTGMFARYALLNANDPQVAGFALLHAAWLCDDGGWGEKGAVEYRCQAADLLLTLLPLKDEAKHASLGVTTVDVLRRASRFAEAQALAETLRSLKAVSTDPTLSAILKLQDRLCEAQDVDGHSVDDAVRRNRKAADSSGGRFLRRRLP